MTTKNIKKFWLSLIVLLVVAAGSFVYLQYGQGPTPTAEKSQVQATSDKVWKIGVMVYEDATFTEFAPFKKKMIELGHEEGGDVEYVIKNAEGDRKVSKEHASEFFADSSIDIILSLASSYRAFDFKEGELTTLPSKVVFSNVGNFERLGLSGLYSSTINKGLNFTGVICGNVELVTRRMEILKEIVPNAKVIGVVFNPSTEDFERTKTLTQKAANKAGVSLLIIEEEDSDVALQRAKKEFTRDTVDGVVYVPGISTKQRKALSVYLVEAGIPAVTWSHTNPVVPDHIAALANDPPDQARQAAAMVHKIMNGVSIDDIPIEFARNLEIHLNTAIAKKAGIKFPQSLLLEASVINSKL